MRIIIKSTLSLTSNADSVGKVKIGIAGRGKTLNSLQELRHLIHQRGGQAALITARWVSLSCHPQQLGVCCLCVGGSPECSNFWHGLTGFSAACSENVADMVGCSVATCLSPSLVKNLQLYYLCKTLSRNTHTHTHSLNENSVIFILKYSRICVSNLKKKSLLLCIFAFSYRSPILCRFPSWCQHTSCPSTHEHESILQCLELQY